MASSRPALLFLAVALLAPATAHAETRVVVVEDFQGRAAGALRAQVVRGLLRGDVRVLPRRDFRAAADRLGGSLTRPADYTAVARRLRVDAFVAGRVNAGGRWELTLTVRDAYSGEIAGGTTLAASRPGALGAVARRAAWRHLGDLILGSATPGEGVAASTYAGADSPSAAEMASLEEEAPPPPDYSRDDIEAGRIAALDPELLERREETSRDTTPFDAAHSPLSAHVGARLLNRGFSYRGDAAGVRPYDLPVGPAIALGAEWYPGAHLTNGALAHLGLALGLSQSIGLSSAGPNEVSYPTSDARWSVGARLRLGIGEGRLELDAAIGRHAFTVEPGHIRDGEPPVASVAYTHAAVGLGAQIPIGDVTIHLSGAWLPVADVGEIGESTYYPDTSAMGFAAMVGFGYDLGSGLELRGALDGRLYLLDFGESTEGPSGALDRHLALTAGIAWNMAPTGI